MSEPGFEALETAVAQGGAAAAFEQLAEQFRRNQQYHELFDARLMQARHRLGLPIILTTSLDDLPEPARTEVEEAYLDACREVGQLLLDAGRLREAWMYLRPAGDREAVAAALERIEPDDEHVEELIDVALHQGVNPRLGFELVLSRFGTCNAITMFDGMLHDRPRPVVQEIAGLLVRHLHGELMDNLRAEIGRQEGSPPRERMIEGLVADRDWLFADDNYHIDTSHLNATVRFARLLEEPEALRLAIDLTEYGRRLSRQYQFAGEEPFVDAYVHQALFFRAQLGEQIDEALAYFRERAVSLPAEEHGTGPAEVYVALLARLGRHGEAMDALAELIPPRTRTSGFAPSLAELAKASGDYRRLREISRRRGDLLGFAAGLVEEQIGAQRETVSRA